MIYELLKRWQADPSSVTEQEINDVFEQRYILLTPSRKDQCLFGAIVTIREQLSLKSPLKCKTV